MHKNKCLNEIVVICLRTISVWRWPAAIVIQKYSYYYSLLCFIIITSIIRFLCSRVHLYFLIFIFLILYLLFMYRILSLWWINYHYHSFNCCCWCCCCCYLLPPTKEEVYVFACVRLSVCLSVCEQNYSKTPALIWMKCCMSTDVGTWTNWLTFEPDPDYTFDAGIYYVGKIPRTGIVGTRTAGCCDAWF